MLLLNIITITFSFVNRVEFFPETQDKLIHFLHLMFLWTDKTFAVLKW